MTIGESLENYIKNRPGCPICLAALENLEVAERNGNGIVIGPTYVQDVKCNKCGSYWCESFRLEGFYFLEDAHGEPFKMGEEIKVVEDAEELFIHTPDDGIQSDNGDTQHVPG